MRILRHGQTDGQTDGAGFIGPAGRQGGSKNWGGTGLNFQILNNFQTSLFIGKCMENGKNSLILAQKREYHGIFST